MSFVPYATFIILNLIYRATTIADKLGVEFALIHRKRDGKERDAPEHMEILVGDVRDKVPLLLLVPIITYLRNSHTGRDPGGRYDRLRKHPHTGSQNIERKGRKIGACTDIPWYAVDFALRPLFICSSGLLSEANLSLVEQLPLKELVVRISNILP